MTNLLKAAVDAYTYLSMNVTVEDKDYGVVLNLASAIENSATDLCAHDKPLPNLMSWFNAMPEPVAGPSPEWMRMYNEFYHAIRRSALAQQRYNTLPEFPQTLAAFESLISGDISPDDMPTDAIDDIRAALTNAKPVDHAPLRDDANAKCYALEDFETYLKAMFSGKVHVMKPSSAFTIKAALQPSVINKHDDLLQEARKRLEAYAIVLHGAGWINTEQELHEFITRVDASLQPINQAEE